MPEIVQGLKDEYRLIHSRVREGGHSAVDMVIAESTGIIYARKIPSPTRDGVTSFDEIKHEASVLELIARTGGNPHIIALHDTDKHHSFLVLPYCPQGTIRDHMIAGYNLTTIRAIYLAIGVCDALSYLDKNGIVHRDIKPSNILLDYEQPFDPVLFDFDIALVNKSKQYRRVGTPYYIAPEIIIVPGMIIDREIDHRADIYSLGATLYHMLTGTPPFTGRNAPYHHVHTLPQNPRRINPAIPKALAQIVLKCLEKDPDDRYQTAFALKVDLEKVLASLQHNNKRLRRLIPT